MISEVPKVYIIGMWWAQVGPLLVLALKAFHQTNLIWDFQDFHVPHIAASAANRISINSIACELSEWFSIDLSPTISTCVDGIRAVKVWYVLTSVVVHQS